ncbi:hypothetical protein GRF59_11765 [Paenibacillus sp. HJL G12]|uniref:Phospholipase C/D domain-containing protein n=1 Tax=Paenibacillus dendrobii TaxID=2691084 RepID=A0A7X3II16_9BACL|nr:hypothetical protein [Paenibacillus dendrobii]MWV44307.1 hypothetical protein [Paenibacillus dendrobii]
MPWPMVHFAVAEKISLSNPSPELLLGSISPDAIHARDPVTRAEKGLTHWVVDGRFPSFEALKMNCIAYWNKHGNAEWKEFVRGYFAHVYTDIRWTETLYADFEKAYAGDSSEIRDTYNAEVSQVEFDLLRSADWADQVIAKLRLAHSFAMDPFVTHEEVSRYRDTKINWLLNPSDEPGIVTRYFQEDRVNRFIEQTSNEFIALFDGWKIDSERSLQP